MDCTSSLVGVVYIELGNTDGLAGEASIVERDDDCCGFDGEDRTDCRETSEVGLVVLPKWLVITELYKQNFYQ